MLIDSDLVISMAIKQGAGPLCGQQRVLLGLVEAVHLVEGAGRLPGRERRSAPQPLGRVEQVRCHPRPYVLNL